MSGVYCTIDTLPDPLLGGLLEPLRVFSQRRIAGSGWDGKLGALKWVVHDLASSKVGRNGIEHDTNCHW
jgi:hypothetical protein